MQETSSSEFVDWKVYCERDVNAFHREDFYLAQIAQEVRRVLSQKPGDIKLSQFLLHFTDKQEEKKPKVDTEEVVKQRTLLSKSFWLGLVGLSTKDKT